ncbi:hypothetical protein AVEN_125526-1 [Araneus ventricosus]|uniref:Reverse transcriptase domain-containing protein n=1 Tax=Araneus ventricosus TaxID=182803 RepID=A0A4Y2QK90_ARAVE|nr:hypothetical protein AVEN_125526-1 [Araneus ventricosus]
MFGVASCQTRKASEPVCEEGTISTKKTPKQEPQIQNCTYNRLKTLHRNQRKFLNKIKPSINPLLEEIRNRQTQDDINKATSHLQNKIIDACKNTYKTEKQEVARPPSWCTSKLEIEKNRLKALRQRAQRKPQDQRSRRFLTLKKDQALYMRHVKHAKNSGWKAFCTNASNPYGKQHKAAFRKTIPPAHLIALKNNNPTGGQTKIADNILEQMFPNPLDYVDLPTLRTNAPDDTPFTKGEIAIVIRNLHKGKAPGPDGIDNIIIQQINKRFPILFMEFYNKCLHLGTFPDTLKLGNIILFKKEGKPEDKASSCRPISLLPTIGKVLEKLLTRGSITTWRDLTRLTTTSTDSKRTLDRTINSPSHSKN